jgi:hypothetical protein
MFSALPPTPGMARRRRHVGKAPPDRTCCRTSSSDITTQPADWSRFLKFDEQLYSSSRNVNHPSSEPSSNTNKRHLKKRHRSRNAE